MAKIELRNVSKMYSGGMRALDDLSLAVEDGEFLVLVGPSGCGKSTALRLVAGLEEVTTGEILADGELLNDLTPQQRNVAMVFQNYALYPHKTVLQNLEFPLRMMKLPRAEIAKRVAEASRLLGLDEYLERRPKQLSGGQRQRVAMGRALVRDPRVFLMDEPLSNLDAALRVEIRAEIAELQRRIGITTIYVTHDQVEAMTLGERVAVLLDGRLQQTAPAQELYDRPANVFVATFIGSPRMNVFRSALHRAADGGLHMQIGERRLPLAPGSIGNQDRLEQYVDQPILVGVRPEAFVPSGQLPEESHLRVRVRDTEALGHEQIIHFDLPVQTVSAAELSGTPAAGTGRAMSTLTARWPVSDVPPRGAELSLAVDTSRIHFLTAEGTAI